MSSFSSPPLRAYGWLIGEWFRVILLRRRSLFCCKGDDRWSDWLPYMALMGSGVVFSIGSNVRWTVCRYGDMLGSTTSLAASRDSAVGDIRTELF